MDVSAISARFWRLCGLKFLAMNDRPSAAPNLWICCKEGMDLNIISRSAQQTTLEASFNDKICRITGVYASTRYVIRRRLWRDIWNIYDDNIAWCEIGDFNCVLGAPEKRGGSPPNQLAC